MQIFWTDNFNRETISERRVVSGLTNEQASEVLAELCRNCSKDHDNWYRAAEDGTEPYTWEP